MVHTNLALAEKNTKASRGGANGALATPKVLVVKLSSLGDVLHTLPIVWDIRKRLSNVQIDWIVEEAYVPLLTPLQTTTEFSGLDRIIPIALRRWRRSLFSRQTWREFFAMRQFLRATTYDVVLETQGLIKSALVCALAKKSKHAIVAGLGNATQYSGYEPLARLFYTHSVQVPSQCHAIDRARRVMSCAFDWPPLRRESEPPQFYPAAFSKGLPKLANLFIENIQNTTINQTPYVLCFHSTARTAKRWANASWIELGKSLSECGYQVIFPWGNDAEKQISQSIANHIPGAIVPRGFFIEEAYSLVAHAALIVGVDTGLTHLAAVLGKPTVEIYCDSPRWKTEGYWSNQIVNHGDIQMPPTVSEVLDTCRRLLAIA